MGYRAHHNIPAPSPSPRAVATFPAAPPLRTTSASCPAWGGRPVPKWTRYGCWDETGTELTVTRIL